MYKIFIQKKRKKKERAGVSRKILVKKDDGKINTLLCSARYSLGFLLRIPDLLDLQELFCLYTSIESARAAATA
jgi:hypothetical protein